MALNNLMVKLKGGSRSGNFGHAGRPGKRGGSASKGGVSSLQPSSPPLKTVGGNGLGGGYNSVKTRSDLEKINQGIFSTMADTEDGGLDFYSRFLVRLHNSSKPDLVKEEIRKFSEEEPSLYKAYKNAMLFDMWKDSGSKLPFGDFMDFSIKAYRGGNDSSSKNDSWSLDKNIAQSFASYGSKIGEFREKLDTPGKVFEKDIIPRNILLYSNSQGEKELVLE